MADYQLVLHPDLLDRHPGSLLSMVLAQLQMKFEKIHAAPVGDPAMRNAVQSRADKLWRMVTAFDPLYREAAAALSAGPTDFGHFMQERTRDRLLITEELKKFCERCLPNGKILKFTIKKPVPSAPDELHVLQNTGRWQDQGDKFLLFLEGS